MLIQFYVENFQNGKNYSLFQDLLKGFPFNSGWKEYLNNLLDPYVFI